MATIDEQFVEFIVKSLVNNPEEVHIERTIDEKGVLLELTVDPEDLGRVIGKRGATAQSIRTLLRALGTKNDARYNLKIVDNGPEKPERTPRREEKKDDKQLEEERVVSDESAGEKVADKTKPKEDKPEKEEESLAERTRKELEDLDDLEV